MLRGENVPGPEDLGLRFPSGTLSDKPAELIVLGFTDYAHATASQFVEHAVARDSLPGSEGSFDHAVPRLQVDVNVGNDSELQSVIAKQRKCAGVSVVIPDCQATYGNRSVSQK